MKITYNVNPKRFKNSQEETTNLQVFCRRKKYLPNRKSRKVPVINTRKTFNKQSVTRLKEKGN